MKKVFAIITMIAVAFSYGQNQNVTNNAGQAFTQVSAATANDFGAATIFVNPQREVKGSVYLFEDWENTGIIHTNDGQRFMLRNINLNLQRNTFESRISRDSLFTFNFNNIKKFVVNNKAYKNFYFDDDSRVYEVIYENSDVAILKGYILKFVEGSSNPMLNRSADKYLQKPYYYIRQNEEIKRFKLSKSRILKLVKDDNKADQLVDYAKNNRLSFGKETDVQKLMEYLEKI